MKRTFVTYGDDNYRESLQRIKAEAEATGLFDSVRLYTPADLPEPFAITLPQCNDTEPNALTIVAATAASTPRFHVVRQCDG